MDNDELYMNRCLQLAVAGAGQVAPNPMVGAVLVFENSIIGEGYHRQYGQAHAEVNCIASVKPADRHLIPESTLYVSLEPCAHFGKTPPCAELILQQRITQVVVGCRDPFPEVNGKGIEKLRASGVKVTTGILEKECLELNKFFFTFHQKHRPYIILKWAQSRDQAIAAPDGSATSISNVCTNRLVHRWRSEVAAILVGTRTAMLDNPSLTTRYWPGNNPVRLVIDRELKLPNQLQIFDGTAPTIIFNYYRNSPELMEGITGNGNWYYQVDKQVNLITQLVQALHRLGIQSVLVEGGTQLLQSFIEEGLWDEARIITNNALSLPNGVKAPALLNATRVQEDNILGDSIRYFTPDAVQT